MTAGSAMTSYDDKTCCRWIWGGDQGQKSNDVVGGGLGVGGPMTLERRMTQNTRASEEIPPHSRVGGPPTLECRRSHDTRVPEDSVNNLNLTGVCVMEILTSFISVITPWFKVIELSLNFPGFPVPKFPDFFPRKQRVAVWEVMYTFFYKNVSERVRAESLNFGPLIAKCFLRVS